MPPCTKSGKVRQSIIIAGIQYLINWGLQKWRADSCSSSILCPCFSFSPADTLVEWACVRKFHCQSTQYENMRGIVPTACLSVRYGLTLNFYHQCCPCITHDASHISEIHINQPWSDYDLAYPHHTLPQDIIRNTECTFQRGVGRDYFQELK